MPTGGSWRRSEPPCPAPLLSAAGPITCGICPPRCRSQLKPWVATLVRTIFDQPDDKEVHAQFARVVDALEGKLPQAAAHLEQARDDLLAFTA